MQLETYQKKNKYCLYRKFYMNEENTLEKIINFVFTT